MVLGSGLISSSGISAGCQGKWPQFLYFGAYLSTSITPSSPAKAIQVRWGCCFEQGWHWVTFPSPPPVCFQPKLFCEHAKQKAYLQHAYCSRMKNSLYILIAANVSPGHAAGEVLHFQHELHHPEMRCDCKQHPCQKRWCPCHHCPLPLMPRGGDTEAQHSHGIS